MYHVVQDSLVQQRVDIKIGDLSRDDLVHIFWCVGDILLLQGNQEVAVRQTTPKIIIIISTKAITLILIV